MLLGIIAKPLHRDKFEVTPDSVAYLTALVAVSEEVRSRCHVKHALPRWPADLSGNSIDNGELPNGVQTVSYKSYVAIIQYTIYLILRCRLVSHCHVVRRVGIFWISQLCSLRVIIKYQHFR